MHHTSKPPRTHTVCVCWCLDSADRHGRVGDEEAAIVCQGQIVTSVTLQLPLLPPANEVCEGYVFTGVCLSTRGGVHHLIQRGGVHGFIWWGGMHGFIWGGMRGFIWGACMVLFRGAYMVLFGGCVWFYLGGMHGFIQGGMHGFIWGCMVLFGGAWFYAGGMHSFIGRACVVLFGGHVWFYLGGHAWFHLGGHAWFFQFFRIQWDTVNERAVHILLECILVSITISCRLFVKHYDFPLCFQPSCTCKTISNYSVDKLSVFFFRFTPQKYLQNGKEFSKDIRYSSFQPSKKNRLSSEANTSEIGIPAHIAIRSSKSLTRPYSRGTNTVKETISCRRNVPLPAFHQNK